MVWMPVPFSSSRLERSAETELPPVKGAAPFTGGNSVSALVSNLLLLNGTGIHSMLTWNGPSWSLSSEFWTYLAFGALLLLYGRHIWMALLPVVVLAPVILDLYSPHMMDTTYDFGLVRCLYGFSAGALLNMVALPSITRATTISRNCR